MKRIRIVFLLLATLLLVPLALLVRKALVSVEAERAMQHRTVADRIIDEMERELTTFLRREEDRPFPHYRYFYVPDEAPAPVIPLVRSPLAAPPEEAFIVGYFQVDPEGTVTTPRWPRNEALAATATGWQPTPEAAAVVARLEATVGKLWSGNGVRDLAEAAIPRAGVTVPLPQRPARSEEDTAEQAAAAEQESDSPQSYLSSLNKAVRSREKRSAKVATTQAPTVYDFSQADENLLQSNIHSRQLEQQRLATEEPAPELWAAAAEVRAEIEETLATAASATIDVRLEPMVGRLAAADQLVLYRTVLIADKAYRQGLVLEVGALMSWLEDRVLAGSELASRARILEATTDPAASGPGYSYLHRFAEPFGSVARVIALDSLPELADTTTVYSMAILLAVAATFGLFALYRMVAVVVDYAERRTNFVSAVTHELKTPLTAIRMYGEMLRDGMVPDASKRQRYYEIMTAEAERLTRLLSNVLELARLEKRTRTMNLVVADVAPTLEEAIAVLGPHAEKEGFALRLELAPDRVPVCFDRDALKQVLFNLLDNALKYSHKAACKKVVVSCRREQEGISVRVADRGPGVSRPHLKRIFEPFYRGESELTRASKGTGIGLALVQGLVERMGGTVTGRNRSAGGFEVSIHLPK